MVLGIRKRMRRYKDLAYVREHLKEIIDETAIKELRRDSDKEGTYFWFYVQLEDGAHVKITSPDDYITWTGNWYIDEVEK